VPEMMGEERTPFARLSKPSHGVLSCGAAALLLCSIGIAPRIARAGDGATEALELRLHAEIAIAKEATSGHPAMAEAMKDVLPELLVEYLVTRDETIALDTVDAAFISEQFEVAQAMEAPGVVWALDVFAGPGTGYEHGLRRSLTNLAGHHLESADRATDAVLDAYERQVDRRIEKADRKAEKPHVDLVKLDAKLDKQAAKLAETTEKKIVKADEKVDQKAAKAADQADKAADKTNKATEKTADKVEKAADKAEKVEKIEKKAEEKAEKAEEKTDKAEDKADKAADKADDKVEDKTEKKADKADDKADKADKEDNDKGKKGKKK
jgi:hypothetical protein